MESNNSSRPLLGTSEAGSSSKSVSRSSSQEIASCYRDLFRRYQHKKDVYAYAAVHYSLREVCLFVGPSVLVQCLLAILPVLLHDQTETLKVVISSIAACSAAWLALGAKLQYGKRGEKFKAVSQAYAALCSETFYKIKEELFGPGRDPEAQKEHLMAFLLQCEKSEKLARNSAPFLPSWVGRVVKKKRKEAKKAEEINAELNEGLTIPKFLNSPHRDYLNNMSPDLVTKERCHTLPLCRCLCGRPRTKIRAPNFEIF